jgi:hypothetical protein
MPSPLVDGFRDGFGPGRTVIVREADGRIVPGLDLDVVVQRRGDTVDAADTKESAWLLLGGRAAVTFDAGDEIVERSSIFDAPPVVLHLAAGTAATIDEGIERAALTVDAGLASALLRDLRAERKAADAAKAAAGAGA